MSDKTIKTAFWVAGIALIMVGAWAWFDRWDNSHENTGYGSIVPWGLWVAVYIYFIGLSAGSR